MQGFILFSVFIGIGINMLCQKYPRFSTTIKIGCICVLLLQFGVTYPTVIPLTTENTYLESYAESELQSLPSKSIYIAFGDYGASMPNSAKASFMCIADGNLTAATVNSNANAVNAS